MNKQATGSLHARETSAPMKRSGSADAFSRWRLRAADSACRMTTRRMTLQIAQHGLHGLPSM